jgi:TonB family protein
VTDPVDRVIVERARMDAGFPGGLLVSLVFHFVLAGVAVAGPLLFPAKPIIRVADAFAVPLPRGDGGAPAAVTPAAPEPKTDAPAPAVEPPKVLKPPKDEPRPSTRAVPDLDPRKARKKAEKPEPARAPAAGPEAKLTGPASATPGLALGPLGPGVPEGTDSGGDWYLAGVQQKIWMIWNQQIKSGFTQPVAVTFTILADGSLAEVHVTQSSGASLLDLAAQRAIYSAAPFAPLPRSYDTTRKTIQAVFRPTS